MPEKVQFYFDEHIPSAVAHALRQRGINVLTAQDAGRCGLPDTDQLQFAAEQGRLLVTFDTDYLALAAEGMGHAGIAYCHPTKYSIGQLIQSLLLVHSMLDRAAVAADWVLCGSEHVYWCTACWTAPQWLGRVDIQVALQPEEG